MKTTVFLLFIVLNINTIYAQSNINSDSIINYSLTKFDSVLQRNNLKIVSAKPLFFDNVTSIKRRLNINLEKESLSCKYYYILYNNKNSKVKTSAYNSTRVIVYKNEEKANMQFKTIKNIILDCYRNKEHENCWYVMECFKGIFIFVYDNMLILTYFQQEGFEQTIKKEGLRNIKYISELTRRRKRLNVKK